MNGHDRPELFDTLAADGEYESWSRRNDLDTIESQNAESAAWAADYGRDREISAYYRGDYAEIAAKVDKAMAWMDATPCGPDDDECDGGIPRHHCANHEGGPK